MQAPDDPTTPNNEADDLAAQAVGAVPDPGAGSPPDDLTAAREAVDSVSAEAEAAAAPPADDLATGSTTTAALAPAAAAPAELVVPVHRPTGITVLGALAGLKGALDLLFALPVMGIGIIGAGVAAGLWNGFLSLASGLVWLAVAYGFFKLRPWTWTLALVVTGLAVLSTVVSALWDPGWLLCGLFGLILPAIVLWYLTRPHVKAAFGR
jgi:hypothetical protein